MRILITDQNFGDDARVERGLVDATEHDLVVEACRNEQDVIAALERHHPDLLLVQFVEVGADAIAHADSVRAIVRVGVGVGVDNVDLAAAAQRGIAVARVPDYCVDEVADHTLALVLAVERKLLETANGTRDGEWNFRAGGSMRRLRGQSFGLLGFGRIAQGVATRATAFGFRMLAHDPALTPETIERYGCEAVGFDVHNALGALEHLGKILDGPVIWAPGVDGAVVLSLRGGDFLFESGQDFAIGYEDHDAEAVRLYFEESFSFVVATAEAAVPLSP